MTSRTAGIVAPLTVCIHGIEQRPIVMRSVHKDTGVIRVTQEICLLCAPEYLSLEALLKPMASK